MPPRFGGCLVGERRRRSSSAVCGYIETGLDDVFATELEGLDRERIRAWYNGCNWLGEAAYNPSDVLLLLDARVFLPRWFETGTPTFLIDVLTKHDSFIPDLTRMRASEALLLAFDVDHPTALGLDLACEDASSHGWLSLRQRFNGPLRLFELKVVEPVPEGAALQQIKDRG